VVAVVEHERRIDDVPIQPSASTSISLLTLAGSLNDLRGGHDSLPVCLYRKVARRLTSGASSRWKKQTPSAPPRTNRIGRSPQHSHLFPEHRLGISPSHDGYEIGYGSPDCLAFFASRTCSYARRVPSVEPDEAIIRSVGIHKYQYDGKSNWFSTFCRMTILNLWPPSPSTSNSRCRCIWPVLSRNANRDFQLAGSILRSARAFESPHPSVFASCDSPTKGTMEVPPTSGPALPAAAWPYLPGRSGWPRRQWRRASFCRLGPSAPPRLRIATAMTVMALARGGPTAWATALVPAAYSASSKTPIGPFRSRLGRGDHVAEGLDRLGPMSMPSWLSAMFTSEVVAGLPLAKSSSPRGRKAA